LPSSLQNLTNMIALNLAMNNFSGVLLMESWCTQELSSIVPLWSVIHVICEYVQHTNPLPSYVAPIRLHVAVHGDMQDTTGIHVSLSIPFFGKNK
jgi:hypothetical protein